MGAAASLADDASIDVDTAKSMMGDKWDPELEDRFTKLTEENGGSMTFGKLKEIAPELFGTSTKLTLKRQKTMTNQSKVDKNDELDNLRRRNEVELQKLKEGFEVKKKSEQEKMRKRLEARKHKKKQELVQAGTSEEEAGLQVDEEAKTEETQEMQQLELKMNKEELDFEYGTILRWAGAGYVRLIRFLINWLASLDADINGEDPENGETALMLGAMCGSKDAVSALMEAGCDPTIVSQDGSTVLHISAQCGHASICEDFIQWGADINAINHDNWSPLIFAAIGGHIAAVEVLLSYQCDLHVVDNDGMNALMYAESAGYENVVEVLKKAGAVYVENTELPSTASLSQKAKKAGTISNVDKDEEIRILKERLARLESNEGSSASLET